MARVKDAKLRGSSKVAAKRHRPSVAANCLRKLEPHAITVLRSPKLSAYLNRYRTLTAMVPELCARTRAAFGPTAELTLALYIDPEIDDRYLKLYVWPEHRDPLLMEKIESVRDAFPEKLDRMAGYFHLTMGCPRAEDGV